MSSDGALKATFDPEKGMNMVEFSWQGKSILDPSTKSLFLERSAGLGALIGPHFHHRKEEDIPPLKDPELFPFFEKLQKKGEKEMFSHGLARYVPWKVTQKEASLIQATLSSEDSYKGHLLKELEGYDFELHFQARMRQNILNIEYEFEAEKPSVIGLHYYYALEHQKGRVVSLVGPKYHHPKGWRPIEPAWLQGPTQLDFKIDPLVDADFGFCPENSLGKGSQIKLVLSDYTVQIDYETDSEENAWQLYHPKGAPYVCLEPLTAHNPREASLEKGRLSVQIKIF